MGQAAKEALLTVFKTKQIDWGTQTTAGSSKNGIHVNLGNFRQTLTLSLRRRQHLYISADHDIDLDKPL